MVLLLTYGNEGVLMQIYLRHATVCVCVSLIWKTGDIFLTKLLQSFCVQNHVMVCYVNDRLLIVFGIWGLAVCFFFKVEPLKRYGARMLPQLTCKRTLLSVCTNVLLVYGVITRGVAAVMATFLLAPARTSTYIYSNMLLYTFMYVYYSRECADVFVCVWGGDFEYSLIEHW